VLDRHGCKMNFGTRGLVVMAVLGMVLGAERADACSCTAPPNQKSEERRFREAKSKATWVFVGKVVSSRVVEAAPPGIASRTVVTFSISKRWKGPSDESVELESRSLPSTDCVFNFDLSEEYLVFVDGPDLIAYVCGYTASLQHTKATTTLARLGRPAWEKES